MDIISRRQTLGVYFSCAASESVYVAGKPRGATEACGLSEVFLSPGLPKFTEKNGKHNITECELRATCFKHSIRTIQAIKVQQYQSISV